MSANSPFCVIPWMHRHVDEQGFEKLCCTAVGDENFVRDEHGRLLHVSGGRSNAEILNQPGPKNVRRQMMNGEWPSTCERCRRAEAAGSVSIRQMMNDQFGDAPETFFAATLGDGTLRNPVVRYADLRLGNACNLTCRMCGPWASRLWAAHFNEVQPEANRVPPDTLRMLAENNWVKRQPLTQVLEQCLPTVERLHFAGGEPLLVPEMADALEQCVASGRAHQIELSYNSNLTVIPEKVAALWPRFRGVTMLCSVDGYGKLNDYIRRPSQWSQIHRNLSLLDRHAAEWKIRWAALTATLQMYNALAIHELFAYLRGAGFAHIQPIPQLVPLYSPPYLSVQCLPEAAKRVARERISAEIAIAASWHRAELEPLIGSARTALAFLDAADKTMYLPDFFSFTEKSDLAFGDSWRDAAPELAALLDPVRKNDSALATAMRAKAMWQKRHGQDAGR